MSNPVSRLNAALEGRYRIERELGEGGMATVYLAQDLKHGRRVAIKVLKPELAAVVGADRFLAEIKTTANLQHPHILPLFDSGEASSFLFYVMPYVDGESLRQRLDREQQLPVDDAIQIAKELAEALDYAHGQGVIHRDIKPANVLLLQGKPVIADFGIALALGTAGGGRLTKTGLSLGTPQYMSPEQATGDAHVGPASDIYALGCILYEMLVGEPPYMGNSPQAILSKIIADAPPPVVRQRASVPANVDAAIRKSLEKLPADRFVSAGDLRTALSDPAYRYGEVATLGLSTGQGPWNRLTMTVVASVLAVALGWSLLRSAPPPPAPVARFSSPFEEGQAPTGSMELTADGSTLVYVGPGESGHDRQLWVRKWADLEATPIRGTEDAMSFVLSPDEREVAFAGSPGPLRVVSLDGGSGRTLVDNVGSVWDWAPDGTVYFSRYGTGLGGIPATGGVFNTVEMLTELEESEMAHRELRVLPGGTMGVFVVRRQPGGEDDEVWALDLDNGGRRFLISGSQPQYAATGHLLFGTPEGDLMAAAIDPTTAELNGPAVPVAEGLFLDSFSHSVKFAVSKSGAIIYAAGGPSEPQPSSLVWVDRDGKEEPMNAPRKPYGHPRLSTDGRRLAIDVSGEGSGIWIWNLAGETLTRLNLGDGEYSFPVWTPDDERVAYASGTGDLYWKASNNTGVPVMLAKSPGRGARGFVSPHFFTPDGSAIVFGDHDPAGHDGLVMISVEAGAPAIWRLNGEHEERNADLSPDGHWLAYQSSESGAHEIYVRPFPQVEQGQVQVSNRGGRYPLWSRDGRELFYVQPGTAPDLISVSIDGQTDGGFAFRSRKVVMPWPYVMPEGRNFDVSPDGQRFVAVKLAAAAAEGAALERVILILNFFEELKTRLPN